MIKTQCVSQILPVYISIARKITEYTQGAVSDTSGSHQNDNTILQGMIGEST